MKPCFTQRAVMNVSSAILRIFIGQDRLPAITGDLEEGFCVIVAEKNRPAAVLWCLLQVFIIISGRIFNLFYWRTPMFMSNTKSLVRNFTKYKTYSLINIFGLAAGMACCILLFLYIRHELSYDRFHKNADRIFRVAVEFNRDGNIDGFAHTQAPLGAALKAEFPAVTGAVTLSDEFPGGGSVIVSFEDRKFWEENVLLAGPDFFSIFSFPVVTGSAETALTEMNSVMLSESTAFRYFGNENPLGKTINVQKPGGYSRDFTITGIFRDVPENSQLRFDFIFSFSLYRANLEWGSWNYTTYIMLDSPEAAETLSDRLPEFAKKYLSARAANTSEYFLQPLTSIHLHSNLRSDLNTNGSILYIYFFASVAFVILALACINFMNLTTIRSMRRAKEIGIRKSLGASRSKLIRQFLQESVLYAAAAMALAVIVAYLFLPAFNDLAGKNLTVQSAGNYQLFLFLGFLAVSVGIAAGSYPAFFISSVTPVDILKSDRNTHNGGRLFTFNKSLVIFQFAVSAAFIVAALIINSQVTFIREMNLGYNKDNLIVVNFHDRNFLSKIDIIKQEVSANPDILGVTATSFLPSDNGYRQNTWWEGMPGDAYEMVRWIGVDQDFVRTFGIEIADGRDFSGDIATDNGRAYILNESAVKAIGWQNPVGKKFRIVNEGTVVGVAKDFHFKPVYNTIEPVVLYYYPRICRFLYIRIAAGSMPQSIEYLRSKWRRIAPGVPFNYSFLDEDFDRIYKTEDRLHKILAYATFLACSIACLGLFAIASYAAEQRRKEIGIRKVLGASIPAIVRLLTGELMLLVLIANIIGLPVTWYFMRRWLDNFAYRIGVDAAYFIIAAASTVFLAFVAAGIQSLKSARADPLDTLKYE